MKPKDYYIMATALCNPHPPPNLLTKYSYYPRDKIFDDMPFLELVDTNPPLDYFVTRLLYRFVSAKAKMTFETLHADMVWYPAILNIKNLVYHYDAFHLLSHEDAIDFEKSKYTTYDGRVMNFQSLVLRSDFVPKSEIFRLDGTSSDFYCLTSEAAAKIKNADLKGLRLIAVNDY